MASNAVIAAIDAAVVLLGALASTGTAALQAIRPLCLTSAQNAFEIGPEAALTGPVQRGDAETIRTHTAALADAARRMSRTCIAPPRACTARHCTAARPERDVGQGRRIEHWTADVGSSLWM